jgi:dipeptidyl aminopeptidase/acylaminoacyl peptidase
MKRGFFSLLLTAVAFFTNAQDGSLVEKKPFPLHDTVLQFIQQRNPVLARKLKDSVDFFRITYLSDGLKVTGYVAEPKAPGKYPCIIANRGGNRDFSQWTPVTIANFLGQIASWNYVVAASQYRGNDGGEGREDFGEKDVNDILNLIPLLQQLPKADTSRVGIEGTSRGGMMTYLSLKKTCRFKAAVITAGMANLPLIIKSRPGLDTGVFTQLIPDYKTKKEEKLKERSAVYWADQLCKTTPLLIMHGSADWRVLPEESMELVQQLYKFKHPVRFILYEGADHGITEYRSERFFQMKRHFDLYLRDGNKWPSMEPHGQ